jgi:ribonucleotide monophosphatase NagD (HAD superfamily)
MDRTWLLDIDGVIFRHNGHLGGFDELLPNVKEFFCENIARGDTVILLSARPERYRRQTASALASYGIRYNHLIMSLGTGERVLVNDDKPRDALRTAFAYCVPRDGGLPVDLAKDLPPRSPEW